MNTTSGIPTGVDFLERLKNQTAGAHKKLENLPVSNLILSPTMDLSDYSHYLSLMYDVHTNMEADIYPILHTIISDLGQRQKAHLIADDLLCLKHSRDKPIAVFKVRKVTPAYALGMLYVVEGASLGGRYILKNVEKISGLDRRKGVSYFTGYGQHTYEYWNILLSRLNEYEQQNNCADEIIAGAVFAFDCIYNHFLNTVKNEN